MGNATGVYFQFMEVRDAHLRIVLSGSDPNADETVVLSEFLH